MSPVDPYFEPRSVRILPRSPMVINMKESHLTGNGTGQSPLGRRGIATNRTTPMRADSERDSRGTFSPPISGLGKPSVSALKTQVAEPHLRSTFGLAQLSVAGTFAVPSWLKRPEDVSTVDRASIALSAYVPGHLIGPLLRRGRLVG